MKRSAWFRYMDRRVTPEELPPVPVHPLDDSDADALARVIIKLPVKQKEVILLNYKNAIVLYALRCALWLTINLCYL